ncbi:MAG: molecular chaperone TorD family protein [Gammaproteobacteria bacterium]|nr:molecular chaperone TorD family protein [Gammaproteobacteria bacterium]MBU1653813.1 molecular chaperone TorD family protein [Gammaproteobacteria bacterium]MBU1962141.1 molecular chaperone TorD family protein [Gammaproteobacteria bacterium]
MSDTLTQFRLGVARDLGLFAFLHHREPDAERLERLGDPGSSIELSLRLSSKEAEEALRALNHGMADLRQGTKILLDEHAAEFAAIYLNHGMGASPCESVWIDEDGLIMQEPMFQVREWYARYGLAAPDWRLRPDDHLVSQLEFISLLFERGTPEAVSDAVRFMDEHLLRWIGAFGQRVSQRALTPFYAGLALLTAVYLDELRDILARLLDAPRPTAEEVDERMRPGRSAIPEECPAPFAPGAGPGW